MHLKNFLIIFVLITQFTFSQTQNIVRGKVISGDCPTAIFLKVNNGLSYGVTVPPNGFGEVQDISHRNNVTFEKEHNSAWYLLSIEKNGELVFDIVPLDTTNDYDFLLYNYTDSTFCQSLKQNKLTPVRSNLSNVKRSLSGITGLQSSTLKNSIGAGIGVSYSKSIDVKKGEKYMLILDNVTPNGKGHTLFFNFIRNVEIEGIILNDDSIPVIADIVLSDHRGKKVLEGKSDLNGRYSFKASLKENQNYNLSIESDSSFVQTQILNTKNLKTGSQTFTDIKVILPKLRKGGKYKLGNINFYGDAATLIPESIPSVESLYKLMVKNKHMVIQIQGHCNNGPGDQLYIIELSEKRAKTIYNYLASKGIDKRRMSTIGYGTSKMLFPNSRNEEEGQANRRVEIKVISIE